MTRGSYKKSLRGIMADGYRSTITSLFLLIRIFFGIRSQSDLAEAEADVADAVGAEAGFEFLDYLGAAVAVELVVDAGLDDADVEDAVTKAVWAGVEGEPIADDLFPGGEDLALGEALGEAEFAHDFFEGVGDGLGAVGGGEDSR